MTDDIDATTGSDAASLDCVEVVELVTDYLEGALEPGERSRLERHLAECDGCGAYLEQMRSTIRASGRLRPETVPADVMSRLQLVFRQLRRA